MENATKALLIAGSVLIAILLIAMGVKIFSSTSSTVESTEATMNATAITSFNTQFTGYLNKSLTASQASTLVQKIIASNAVNKSRKVTFNSLSTIPTTASAGIYQATVDENTGYITDIYKSAD